MKYAFILNWNELSEELQEEKIEEYIRYLYREGEYTDRETGEQTMTEDEAVEDQEIRDEAINAIEAHFPTYF